MGSSKIILKKKQQKIKVHWNFEKLTSQTKWNSAVCLTAINQSVRNQLLFCSFYFYIHKTFKTLYKHTSWLTAVYFFHLVFLFIFLNFFFFIFILKATHQKLDQNQTVFKQINKKKIQKYKNGINKNIKNKFNWNVFVWSLKLGGFFL